MKWTYRKREKRYKIRGLGPTFSSQTIILQAEPASDYTRPRYAALRPSWILDEQSLWIQDSDMTDPRRRAPTAGRSATDVFDVFLKRNRWLLLRGSLFANDTNTVMSKQASSSPITTNNKIALRPYHIMPSTVSIPRIYLR